MQKKLPSINSEHGSETRNIINELIKLFNGMGHTYNESLKMARNILIEAKKTNDMNKSVQEQINALIAESGTSDAEVIQARIDTAGDSHKTLKARLDNSYNKINNRMKDIQVSVKDFGAVGDGIINDTPAFKRAIEYVYDKGGGTIHIPTGTFFLEESIHTKNSDLSHDKFSHGIIFSGNGWGSVITGKSSSPANYSDKSSLSNDALISLHGSNNVIENIRFTNSKVGLYLGQDPSDVYTKSNVGYNRMNNLWFEYVGTSIILQPGYGCYYNTFENIHTRFGQIGIHLAVSFFENDDTSVSNRNVFSSCVTHHSWIGIILHAGDTNTFNNCNLEQINNSGNDYIGQVPQFISGGTPTGLYLDQITSYGVEKNTFYGCMLESVERHLYYKGYGNNFINNFIDSKKIEIDGDLSNVGTYIGTYNSEWQGFKMAGLSINTSTNNPLMIGKDYGVTLKDELSSRIFDEGLRHEKHKVLDLTTDIQKVFGNENNNGMYVWSLSGVRNIIFKATFTLSSNLSSTDAITINLPEKYKPSIFFKPSSYEGMYRFSVVVGSKYVYQNVIGTYDIHSNKIIINPPSNGWALPGEDGGSINHISFDTRFFEDLMR